MVVDTADALSPQVTVDINGELVDDGLVVYRGRRAQG